MNEYKSENLFKHEEIYSYDDCESDNNFEKIDKTLEYLYGLTEVDLKVTFEKILLEKSLIMITALLIWIMRIKNFAINFW